MGAHWFKLYAADLLSDSKIRLLTDDQLGKLLKLWAFACKDGSIPSDLAIASRLLGGCCADDLAWVPDFFVSDGSAEATKGTMVSRRMMAEQTEYAAKCERLRVSASKGGLKKAENALANAIANGLAKPTESESESESDKRIYPPAFAEDEVKLKQAKPRKNKMQELDNYPAELHEAISTWRGLLKAMRNHEIMDSFPVEKRFLPAAVGTVEATWKAWQKHRATMVQGHPVMDADILAAVKMWASAKMANATNRENPSLAAPMLPSMINKPDFVDAVIRSVKARIAMESEVANVA